MVWATIIVIISCVWILGKISAIRFGGVNPIMLIAASMLILVRIVTGERILKKTDAVFARMPMPIDLQRLTGSGEIDSWAAPVNGRI